MDFAGVAEMTEQFWPEMEPWIEDAARNHPRASLSFTGHSLGGSMATLLMAWFFVCFFSHGLTTSSPTNNYILCTI